jgi:sulfatase modifying factor 1
MPRSCSSLLLSLLIASAASAVTIDWTPIGNPGNACDPQPTHAEIPGGCFGAVAYSYNIGTYEVTNAQYAEFLNAKASGADPFTLYDPNMGDPFSYGGIARTTDSGGNFVYTAIPGRENRPVNYVAFADAMRFVNWMNNGQGSSSTETGTYTLDFRPTPLLINTITRNPGAQILLPSEDEWYKAAYYDSLSSSYFDYPASSNNRTTCSAPSALANRANCGQVVGDLTNRGSYTGSASPYGTFDQGGNVAEWNEAIFNSGLGPSRGVRGGNFLFPNDVLAALFRATGSAGSGGGQAGIGFRLAMIPGGYVPEPGTGMLVIGGLLGVAVQRRGRA